VCVCATVVYYCHSRSSIENRFLFYAQDHNMTNGDFAFFTSHVLRSSSTDRPWDRYVDDPQDRPYRRRAYYAVKQVTSCFTVLNTLLIVENVGPENGGAVKFEGGISHILPLILFFIRTLISQSSDWLSTLVRLKPILV